MTRHHEAYMVNSKIEISKQVTYIIHHSSIRLEDILITLCSSYDYSLHYTLPLIIDWRNSRWMFHQDIPNLFEILFDNQDHLESVDIITDPIQNNNLIPNEDLNEILYPPKERLSREIRKLYAADQEELLPKSYVAQISHAKIALIKSLQISTNDIEYIFSL